MTRFIRHTTILCLLCSLALPAWGQQYYLYEPKPVKAEEKDQAKNGVLVTEVTVKKGDTLKEISRTFTGRASYFPQILLFNKISNPDLIHPGQTFRVPVSQGATAAASETVNKSNGKSRKRIRRKKGAAQESISYNNNGPAAAGVAAPVSPVIGDAFAGQKLFERAINAYKQEDFGTALELFDRYLAGNPNSPLAADATLYKAECYLKLSSR